MTNVPEAFHQFLLILLTNITWHILGDRLIPLAALSLVGFYM